MAGAGAPAAGLARGRRCRRAVPGAAGRGAGERRRGLPAGRGGVHGAQRPRRGVRRRRHLPGPGRRGVRRRHAADARADRGRRDVRGRGARPAAGRRHRGRRPGRHHGGRAAPAARRAGRRARRTRRTRRAGRTRGTSCSRTPGGRSARGPVRGRRGGAPRRADHSATAEETLEDGETGAAAVVAALREADGEQLPEGLDSYVAGPAGATSDFAEAFGEIDGILLGVALGAVLVILLLVYRSPALPFLVIFSAVFALCAASVVVYLLAAEDVVGLNGQSQGILFILVVGAATDYALLLVSRYREELRRHDDPYRAMGIAWRRAFEPVVASGTTVVLGLLCLLLSDLGSNRGLGPVASVGIVAAMLSALTFLPAVLLLPGPVVVLLVLGLAGGVPALVAGLLGAGTPVVAGVGVAGALLGLGLSVLVGLRLRRRTRRRVAEGRAGEGGRWVFWPVEPHVGSSDTAQTGVWARVARLVGRRPRAVWVSTVVVLGALAAFLPLLDADGVAQSDVFLVEVESVSGGEVLAAHFPAGSSSPTYVLVDEADAEAALAVVGDDPGVTSADLTREAGGDPRAPGEPVVVDGRVQVEAVLSDPSDSLAAQGTVQRLRDDLDQVSTDALVGGATAQQLDVLDVSTADLYRIIPVVLAVIFVVLALLLRSLVAPALILAANILSFAATLGASALVFRYVLGYPGADPAVPLFGFVFLVALGIDYSIFLMTRVREESARVGTRPGILAGLSVTGGVITSAGIVLAATFAALGVLPILFLAQIAFIVAFGVLLDTFVVRSLLVPALGYELGRRVWWPHPMARADAPGELRATPHGRHATTTTEPAV
ncbi:MMPL family transporter [Aquipuribacter hungaricus]|uniref:MMPL family transporter n=1 Tax=Aquipuribacter hungaricus TaxID=545624 RepID=UPI00361CE04A